MRIMSFLLSFMLVTIVATSTNVSHAKAKRHVFTCDMHSGKTLQRKASRFNAAINSASKRYGVDKSLIKAVITVESCFNPRATGGLGEKGLMQLMPGTARQLGVRNGYNSWENIHGGAKYLSFLLTRFGGNKRYAAAAYNGGPGAVSRARGPKFKQVRRYSRHVMRAYNKLARTPSLRGRYKGRRVKRGSNRYKKTRYSKRSTRLKRSRGYKLSRNKKNYRRQSKRYKKRTAGKRRHTLRSKKSHSVEKRIYRKVRKGDTLYSLSKRSNISLKRLRKLNKLGRSNHIKVGRNLRIR